jgi:hypothetical protein
VYLFSVGAIDFRENTQIRACARRSAHPAFLSAGESSPVSVEYHRVVFSVLHFCYLGAGMEAGIA